VDGWEGYERQTETETERKREESPLRKELNNLSFYAIQHKKFRFLGE